MDALPVGTPIADWIGTVRVGVTGHRAGRLGNADVDAIAASIGNVLRTIRAAAPGTGAMHLISSLADGADSIAADVAIAAGWRVDAVLPLPAEDYVADFAGPAAQAEFERRVACTSTMLELPDGDGDRAIAYERAGRIMLAQSDLLIAIWDGAPSRGRGGATQMIAEAVDRGLPVVHIDPGSPDRPTLLWDGLDEHDAGQQTLETVARGDIARLPELVASMTHRDVDPLGTRLLAEIETTGPGRRTRLAIAYPLLLAVLGVRRLRWSDFGIAKSSTADISPAASMRDGRIAHADFRLGSLFHRADEQAVRAAQVFRSAYVTNFALAAFAVTVSLAGLALPHQAKPLLALIELLAIGSILLVTRTGRRGEWHRRWLDQRHLAERLRCLRLNYRLGDLGLRRGRATEGNWVTQVMHAAGRMAGLPSVRIDQAYLSSIKTDLTDLLDSQIAYLPVDARRMHSLEHRLHKLGTALFGVTALICFVMVVVEIGGVMVGGERAELPSALLATAATIASAALPACGAAIYGIRMQGDFAGVAERASLLASNLRSLRVLVEKDPAEFDILWRHVEHATDLLTNDLSSWLHAYRARPLVLPG